ncbi:MAG: hypothetical protein L6R37_005332 [Teloschistes peruensis]|nr:MAG: hypothetical protein L6R37_005332 [Teloschistes peruensis]
MAKAIWTSLFIISYMFTVVHGLPAAGSSPLDFSSNALFVEFQSNNATTTTHNASAISSGNGISRCDGSKYRSNLQKSSCQNAILQIPQTQSSVRFRWRSGGGSPSDLPLPQRFISKDGLCIAEVVLKDKARSGRAKWSEIAKAAVDMYFGCVVPKGEGSMAMDIGEDKTLGLIMTSYTPRVTCLSVRDAPPIVNCMTILDKMFTSPIPRVFGIPGKAKPDVPLPKLMQEAQKQCQFIVRTTDAQAHEDWSSWYEIWEAVQALIGMCVQYGKTGFALRGRKNQLLISAGRPF